MDLSNIGNVHNINTLGSGPNSSIPTLPPRPKILKFSDLNSHAVENPNSGSSNMVPAMPPRPHILGLRELGIMMNTKRQAALKPMRGAASGRFDLDDSGTYDPQEDVTRRATRTRNSKKVRLQDDEDGNQRSRRNNSSKGTGNIKHQVFTSTNELGLDASDPVPHSHKSILSGAMNIDASSESSMDSEEEPIADPRHDARRVTRRQKKPTLRTVRNDGLVIEQLTSGHPQIWGCKACFDAGDDECSLIEDRHDYPCVACYDANIDCVFIEPPEFKKVCERCKRKRVACSYGKDGGKGVGRCETCEEIDVPCCAGPLRGRFQSRKPKDRTKKSKESITASNLILTRKFVSCNQCRFGKLKCSLRRGESGPCRKCHTNGEDCEFEQLPAKFTNHDIKARATSSTNRKDTLPGNFSSPLSFEENLVEEAYLIGASKKRSGLNNPSAGFRKNQVRFLRKCNRINQRNSKSPELIGTTGGITHIKIKTAFSHPISFFHNPAPNGSESCDWCKTPFYGLEGYGEITVEVIPANNGHGYEEIGDGEHAGWGQKGRPPSRMCEACTLSRFDIISCEQHSMKLMEDKNPLIRNAQAWNRAIDALVREDEVGGQLILTAKFCAICSALADYQCCNDGEHLHGSGDDVGCGLSLCETCNDLMSKMEIGKTDREINEGRRINVLDDVIREAKAGWAGYYGGESDQHVRADVSFLTTSGELYTRLLQGMGGYVDVSDQKSLGKTLDLANESSSDDGESADQETGQGIERAMKEESYQKDISRVLAPRLKAQKPQSTFFNANWFGKPLHEPFITPKAKPTLNSKTKHGEGSKSSGKAKYSDWMETRPVTSKNSWANSGGSGDRTTAYIDSANSAPKRKRNLSSTGKDLKETIIISDDDDDEYGPILRGY